MTFKHALSRRAPLTAVRSAALVLVLALVTAAPVLAQGLYLPANKPDGIALLPPPPVAGSEEEAADLGEVRAVFKGRTPSEEQRARNDASLKFSVFARAIGPSFDLKQLPKTEALMKRVKQEIGEIINSPKNHWKRTRPYVLDPNLVLGDPEPSYSYPSGHSTRGTVYAGVLAELFPDKKDAILAVGREIGWDRVLIGKHFPTDVFAGRMLGKAIVRELLASPAFQHDLAEAKAELQSAPATAAVAR